MNYNQPKTNHDQSVTSDNKLPSSSVWRHIKTPGLALASLIMFIAEPAKAEIPINKLGSIMTEAIANNFADINKQDLGIPSEEKILFAAGSIIDRDTPMANRLFVLTKSPEGFNFYSHQDGDNQLSKLATHQSHSSQLNFSIDAGAIGLDHLDNSATVSFDLKTKSVNASWTVSGKPYFVG